MSYLLDTGTLLQVLRSAPSPSFVRRLSQVGPVDRCTSAITISQILLGARLQRRPRLMQDVVRLASSIRVLPFGLAAAQSFAKFRTTVAVAEDVDDVMIAAIAASGEHTLVTSRPETFAIFPDLRIEDWMA